MGGRGTGKTRSGAEWVIERVLNGAGRRIALVASTMADARDVMVEGESGILAISPPWFRPHYEPSKRRLTWANGAIATLYSAEEPDSLRGPQHDSAWCDELAKWIMRQNGRSASPGPPSFLASAAARWRKCCSICEVTSLNDRRRHPQP
jgi:phage terminase large subunit-like protein